MTKSAQAIETVNTALDVSAVEYEREPRYRSGGYSGERRERTGGDRQFEFGTFSGNRCGGGSRDRDRRDRGRLRDLAKSIFFFLAFGPGPIFSPSLAGALERSSTGD